MARGVLSRVAQRNGNVASLGSRCRYHRANGHPASTAFYVASRQIAFLTARPVVAGILYGIAVYLFMYLIVQRLAGLHPKFTPLTVSRAVLVHIFCVGLPIALSVRAFSRPAGP